MIKLIEHFSFTVSNLKDSLHFFCDLLGLKATPITEVNNDEVQKIVGMPGAHLRIALVQVPNSQNVELIEYVEPRGKKLDLKTCDPGVGHLAFLVDDIQKMYDDLSKKGVKFRNPPVWALGNDGKGRWGVCYLTGPDGITLELIEKNF
jgi:catechol 2,3-dioxygenase-like lactoylglutathione lyase family enzyme